MTRVFEVVSKASFAVVLRVLCRAEYCCVLNWSSLGVGWCVIFVHCSLFHSLLSSLLPPSECPAGCQSSAAHRPQLPTALSCPPPSAAQWGGVSSPSTAIAPQCSLAHCLTVVHDQSLVDSREASPRAARSCSEHRLLETQRRRG